MSFNVFWLPSALFDFLIRLVNPSITRLLLIFPSIILATGLMVLLMALFAGRTNLGQFFLATFLLIIITIIDAYDMLSVWSEFDVPLFWRRSVSRVQQRLRRLLNVPQYDYEPLSMEEIRILQLLPRNWSLQGTVLANLICVKRDSKLEYTAVSYRWGELEATEEILVHNARLRVTKSALNVLLRCASREETVSIWMDAICINQNDLDERALQVRFMRRVYENAANVLAFPGCGWRGVQAARMLRKQADHTSSAERAEHTNTRSFLGTISGAVSDLLEPRLSLDKIGGRRDREDIARDLSALAYARPWRAVLKLAQEEYFQRAWIVQELYANKQVELFLCGRRISFDLFGSVMMVLGRPDVMMIVHMCDPTTSQNGRVKGYFDQGRYLASAHFLCNIRSWSLTIDRRNEQGSESDPTRLQNLIFETRVFGATKRRDKLFAVLGVASDVLAEETPDLHPNYTQSLETISQAFASYLLLKQKFGSINILALAGIGYLEERPKMPSWVPDLSQENLASVLTPYIPQPGKHLQACGIKTTVQVGSLEHNGHQTIVLGGVICDSIVGVGKEIYSPSDSTAANGTIESLTLARAKHCFLFNAIRVAKQIPQLRHEESKPNGIMFSEICTTLSSGAMGQIPTVVVAKWLEMLNRSTEVQTNAQFVEFLQGRAARGQTDNKEQNAIIEQAGLFDSLMSTWSRGRRFAIAASQQYCLVPPLTKVGDIVFVPFGGYYPFLIRPVKKRSGEEFKKHFELVGEAYVHGIMNGEAVGREAVTVELI